MLPMVLIISATDVACMPPSGPIGLEGDRGQMEYRRIRLKEE